LWCGRSPTNFHLEDGLVSIEGRKEYLHAPEAIDGRTIAEILKFRRYNYQKRQGFFLNLEKFFY
jgi:uncharacterized protein VirK/YbjX